jgi:hypothetical protein
VKHSYRVELDDGTEFEVTSDARDIRRWEAVYGKSWLNTPLSYTEVAQLVYLASARTGVLNGRFPTYDEFDAHCVATEGLPTPPIANPTPPVATDALSAP